MTRCGTCGSEIGGINSVCDHCLPNFYSVPQSSFYDITRTGAYDSERRAEIDDGADHLHLLVERWRECRIAARDAIMRGQGEAAIAKCYSRQDAVVKEIAAFIGVH